MTPTGKKEDEQRHSDEHEVGDIGELNGCDACCRLLLPGMFLHLRSQSHHCEETFLNEPEPTFFISLACGKFATLGELYS